MCKYKLILLLISFVSLPALIACERPLRHVESGSSTKVTHNDQLAKNILQAAGCELQAIHFEEFVTFDRRLALLEKGEIDLIISVSKLPERERFAYFSKAISQERVRLWAVKQNIAELSDKNLSELINQNKRITGPSAGWFGQDYEDLKKSVPDLLSLYSHVPNGVALLVRGRADVMLGSEDFSDYFLQEHKDKVEMLPQIIHEQGYHLMYSKKTVSNKTIQHIDSVITSFVNK